VDVHYLYRIARGVGKFELHGPPTAEWQWYVRCGAVLAESYTHPTPARYWLQFAEGKHFCEHGSLGGRQLLDSDKIGIEALYKLPDGPRGGIAEIRGYKPEPGTHSDRVPWRAGHLPSADAVVLLALLDDNYEP
jgi:hypothetical protein